MESKDMLNVSIDLEKGVYTVSRNNGKESVAKSINENGTRSYDTRIMNTRREEISKGKLYTKWQKQQIDPVLYDALEEFDNLYSTNYAKTYIETTTKLIESSFTETKSQYTKRVKAIKEKDFEDAKMSINYNLSLFKAAKSLSLADRIQFFKLALLQRLNGVKINMKNSKKLNEIQQAIPVNVVNQPETKEEVVALVNSNAVSIDLAETQQVNQILAKIPKQQEPMNQDVSDKNKIDRAKRKDIRNKNKQRKQQKKDSGQGKTLSRSKTIKSSKQIARKANQISYQDRIAANENRKIEAEKARQAAETKRIAEEQAKLARKEQGKNIEEKKDAQVVAQTAQSADTIKVANKKTVITPKIRKLLLGINDTEIRKQTITKFTRKIKDKTKNIRNKIRIPKKLNKKRLLLGSAVGVVGVLSAATFMLQPNVQANKNIENVNTPTETTDVTTPSVEESKNPINIIETPGEESVQPTFKVETPEQENKKPTSEIQAPEKNKKPANQEKTEGENQNGEQGNTTTSSNSEESKEEYLSKVHVGVKMNISEGKYYECPEGTGDYGYFENYKDQPLTLTTIGISTYEGYNVVNAEEINLLELKKQYPDGEFSYHYVIKDENDQIEKILGWTNERIMNEYNEKGVEDYVVDYIDNTSYEIDGEER